MQVAEFRLEKERNWGEKREESKEEIADAEREEGGQEERDESTMSPTSVRQIMMHRQCRGWFYHRRLIRDA